jgi:hypothetical protein
LIDVLPYDYEDPVWGKILGASPSGEVILREDDVEKYSWEDQEIILGVESSKRVVGLDLIERSFVACLGEKPLFGGSFIERGSARAIRYPVIYVEYRSSRLVLQLRPIHVGFEDYRSAKMKLSPEIRGRIEVEGVKKRFSELGKLN